MKVKKFIGKTINGFTILDSYPLILESGKKTRKVLVKCARCGRKLERNSGVNFEHIKCKCMCRPEKPSKFHFMEFEDKKYTLTEFARLYDLPIETLSSRLKAGESPEQAIKNEIERECICCGKKFIGDRRKKYCSDKCYKHSYKQKYKSRIRKTKEPDPTINLIKLYNRDKGICQICKKPIDFNCNPNSDNYPSIDHIKPIAKGGLHQWDNVQLTCRKCNYLKGDEF